MTGIVEAPQSVALPKTNARELVGRDSVEPAVKQGAYALPPTPSSVAKHAHRRVVHESACGRLTPCGIDLPTINDANGRNRCCADAAQFDALRDERTGDENCLLSYFFL